jgi:hypothetical protein
LARFLDDLKKFGISRLSEGQAMAAWEQAIRARIGQK